MFTLSSSSNQATASTSAQYTLIADPNEQTEATTQTQYIEPDERIKRVRQLALSDYENSNKQSFKKALDALKIKIDFTEQNEDPRRLFKAQNIQVNIQGIGAHIHNALLIKARTLEQTVTEEIDKLLVDIINNRVTKDIVKTDGSFSLFDEFLTLKYELCPQVMQAIHTLAQHGYTIENFSDFDYVEGIVENASMRLNRAMLQENMGEINKWPYITKFIVFSLSFSMVWILYSYMKREKDNSPFVWPVIVATLTYSTSLLFLGSDILADFKKSKINNKKNYFNLLDNLYKKICKDHERTWRSVLLHRVNREFRVNIADMPNMPDEALVDLSTQRAASSDKFKKRILQKITLPSTS